MVSSLYTAAVSAALILSSQVQAELLPRFSEAPACTDFTPFQYVGCYQDPSSPRALPFSDQSMNTQNMTVEFCTAWCKGNGYRYAGLEYYGECFCGAAIGGPQIDESNCAFPCTGDKSETCGGNDILSVWEDPTFASEDSTSIADYQLAGCYTEGVGSRALVFFQDQIASSTMTTEICLAACKADGYPLSGTEYSGECYCGIVLDSTSNPVDSATCTMPCNGNTNEICGGPSLLNLYVAKDLESSEACISDGVRYWTGTSSSSSMVSTSTLSSTTSSSLIVTTTSSSSSSFVTSTTSSASSSSSSSTSLIPSSTSSIFSSTSIPVPPQPTTTTFQTSTTTNPGPIFSSTTASMCTKTITTTTTTSPTPTTCQYAVGNWCSTPLPSFNDASSCQRAASNCLSQYNDCFAKAGWPATLTCLQFAAWCEQVQSFCYGPSCWSFSSGSCDNKSCFKKYPPRSGSSGSGSGQQTPCVVTTTTVYPCPASSTSVAVGAVASSRWVQAQLSRQLAALLPLCPPLS